MVFYGLFLSLLHRVAQRIPQSDNEKAKCLFKILWKEIGVAIAVGVESPQALGVGFGGNWGDQRKPTNDVQNANQNRGLAMENAAIRHKKNQSDAIGFLYFGFI